MRTMKFRLKAFGLHLLASATVLTLILGALYLGWYHWPGWYLANATQVVLVLICVDVVIGPLLTFVIASPSKPRRELARDIGIIATVQICALIYGSGSLWNGRPLYYGFSENVLQVVQAYDIEDEDAALGRKQNPSLAPHWYSLPRWVWAPVPDAPKGPNAPAIDGMFLPKYFKPWGEAQTTLRRKLQRVDDWKFFTLAEKKILRQRMQTSGFAIDQPYTIPMTGRARPLLVVVDPATLEIKAFVRCN
jgi:hypothetical protein